MPRLARKRSENGIYHVMIGGINRQNIFLEDGDNKNLKIDSPTEILGLDSNQRDSCLKEIKDTYGLSIRQIESLTGIGRGVIQKI